MEEESKYINPLTDYGFKFFFGNEANKDFTISLLTALFPEEGEVTDVTLVDKEIPGANKNARALIYDIHCETASGKKYIVEMQNRYQTYFRDRVVYYIATDLASQGKKGKEWDYQLTPVYGVFVMNFDWREFANDQIREDVGLMNTRTHELFSDKVRMVFLKLPLLTKDEEECTGILDRWLYILKNMENMERIPASFMNDRIFRRFDKVARVASLPKRERDAYEHSLKVYRDNYAIAQTERNEGFVEGRSEMQLEGAVNFLKAGVEPKMVADCLGLPLEKVLALKSEL